MHACAIWLSSLLKAPTVYWLFFLISDGEYVFVDHESKISKYAPKAWKSSQGGVSIQSWKFSMQLRCRHYTVGDWYVVPMVNFEGGRTSRTYGKYECMEPVRTLGILLLYGRQKHWGWTAHSHFQWNGPKSSQIKLTLMSTYCTCIGDTAAAGSSYIVA